MRYPIFTFAANVRPSRFVVASPPPTCCPRLRQRKIDATFHPRIPSRPGASQKGCPVQERTGEAFEMGMQLTVVGRKLKASDEAPEFALDHLDAASGAISTVRLSDSAGAVRLLNVINSLDTPICHTETCRWQTLLVPRGG